MVTKIEVDGTKKIAIIIDSSKSVVAPKLNNSVKIINLDSERSLDISFDLIKNSELTLVIIHNLKDLDIIKQKVKITHIGGNSKSKVTVHSVLDNQSKLCFTGVIHNPKKIDNTVAELIHKTLLLSDEAEVESNPELLIDNDQVKCAHGSTISALDKKELFYLQSRGINKKEAEQILVNSFINQIWQQLV